MCRFSITRVLKSFAICSLILGAGSAVHAQRPFQTNFREIFATTVPSQPTRSFKNIYDFPMIIDFACVRSENSSPVFLQVMGPGLIVQGGSGLVGDYPFTPTQNVEGGAFLGCQTTNIVILPGDTLRGVSPGGAVFSISVSGHFVFPPFFFPN